jgi:hypothetical protein
MPDTPKTSGGTIEHEVYMMEGIILIVIELKLYFKDLRDHFAQVLLELACECRFCTESDPHVAQRHTDSTAPKNSTINLPFTQS